MNAANHGESRLLELWRNARDSNETPAFEINAGKLVEKTRFDGILVWRTSAKVTSGMRTFPIFHSSHAAMRGQAPCISG